MEWLVVAVLAVGVAIVFYVLRRSAVPAEPAPFMRQRFDTPAAPARALVLRLTGSEQGELGLPPAPPWIHPYL